MRQAPFDFSSSKIKLLAAKIASGKTDFTEEELQLQQNSAAELEKELTAFKVASSKSATGESKTEASAPHQPAQPAASPKVNWWITALLVIVALIGMYLFMKRKIPVAIPA